ncbi:MAG: acyl-CoA dehydrogenase family protein [Longimonas sp.]|uniref:acyl-CoA dehydrogenase family protein n=1 Tax=Longimonas sp. TaxID=2039626 RepID=UPI003974FF0B
MSKESAPADPAVDTTQAPPELGNQYTSDRVLTSYLKRTLPEAVRQEAADALHALGERAGGDLYALQQADRTSEPELTQWSPWGKRIDKITLTDVWKTAAPLAAEYGLVALPYEQPHGAQSRPVQFALAHLFIPSTDMYGCPLAMTDGATRTLLAAGNDALIDEAVPHLTSRAPESAWTSGQWMTELAGGSDVGQSNTTARQDNDGTWRLYGRKWFTSAITANMALALARPEGNPDGGRGLALFYVRIRTDDGALKPGLRVLRLKDKLGTRKLPTAELHLNGVEAMPVTELKRGTRHIAPMLNITRTWNAVTATSFMRRSVALSRDYATKRTVFGKKLIDQPLHQDTLAQMQSTYEGAFHLSFRVAELLGRDEADTATDTDHALLRLLTPIAKLLTAKQCVSVTSEAMEAFGGAGYVEDTGLPQLHRDAQVLPIWEGTTNVLALDLLRALKRTGGLAPLRAEFKRCMDGLSAPRLIPPMKKAAQALQHAQNWLHEAQDNDAQLQGSARRFAYTVGSVMEVALTVHHAQWALNHENDARPAEAAVRLAAAGIDHLHPVDPHGAHVLAHDFNCPTLFECHTGTADTPAPVPTADTLSESAFADGQGQQAKA